MRFFDYDIRNIFYTLMLGINFPSYAVDIPILVEKPTWLCPVVEGNPSSKQSFEAEEFRALMEKGVFFQSASLNQKPVSCGLAFVSNGSFFVQYKFLDKSWLSIERNSSAERTEQVARAHFSENPEAILKKVEKSLFPPNGCGITWQEPEVTKSTTSFGAVNTVFKGDACSCQARVQRSATGKVVELAFKSTCQ
jgi:hypothetical protein